MRQTRRIGAYGLCRDEGGRVLLARGSGRAAFPGVWSLPGGGAGHGEHPAAAVVREFAEETGLAVEVTGLLTVCADVLQLPDGTAEHTDRVVYRVASRAGALRPETDGTTDRVAWFGAAELAGLPLLPFTAELLGQPVDPAVLRAPAGAAGRLAAQAPPPAADPDRGRRFGAYGLVTDPGGRVLLSLIATGYPGAGRWHLPGGGTDHGEQPETAVLRELAEESGQVGRVVRLLDVSHHHNPAARGPEGRPIDWHVVRVLFRVEVELPTEPVVTEAAGGSTARAAWFTFAEAGRLPLTDLAAGALNRTPQYSVPETGVDRLR